MLTTCLPRLGLALFLLSYVTTTLYAQNSATSKPDFSGEWVNRETSMVIKQNDNRLTIATKYKELQAAVEGLGPASYTVEATYYLDGRGETQKSTGQKSTTNWQGDKIVTSFLPIIGRDGKTFAMQVLWEIASDRSELMRKTILTVSNTEKTVYDIYVPKNRRTSRVPPYTNKNRPATAPTFAGTWLLDWSKEEDAGPVGDYILVIEHADPEVKFKRSLKTKLYTRQETLTYYTDGRGDENIENGESLSSKAKRDGRDIVITISSTSRIDADRVDRTEIHRWKVSEDGNTLKQIINVKYSSPNKMIGIHPPRQVTHTFVRVP